MINAKNEFLSHVHGKEMPAVLCAKLTRVNLLDEDDCNNYILKSEHDDIELEKFLTSIDFQYDDGYGGQELFGTIWYKDGTFSQRGEYDGSEWWEHISVPEIPKELI